MKTTPLQIMSSHTTCILLSVYAVIMAAATIVEKFCGSDFAKTLIYYSPLFIALQALMVINFVTTTISHKYFNRKKWTYATIHTAFIIILLGAITTHLTGKEGIIHIREGERSNEIVTKEGSLHQLRYLPFDIELKDFVLTRYPGSQSPSSYESYLRLYKDDEEKEVKVYMNNVLDIKGYRFYQASYDPDECGTILSVNYDPYGRTITYFGYTLLILGLAMMFVDRHSRFRRLWRKLNGSYLVSALLFLGYSPNIEAQDFIVPVSHAENFGKLTMQSNNGRFIPVNTFAHEIIRKFDAEDLIGNLSPEQAILSIYTYPSEWSKFPFIKVKDKELLKQFGWNKQRIAYHDAFDEHGFYKLSKAINLIYSKKPSDRTRYDKELLKVDDLVNIMHGLLNKKLIRIFPNASDTINHRWLAIGEITTTDSTSTIATLSHNYILAILQANKLNTWADANKKLDDIATFQQDNENGHPISISKIRAEILYNKLDLLRYCQFGYLILGALMLILPFITINPKGNNDIRDKSYNLLLVGSALLFTLHTFNLGLRWYISGYVPWSNSYETMVSLSWAGMLCGFTFVRRSHVVGALATLFSGIILFVSSLNWMDPQITPLVPVLKSPWLMAHVATVVIAYGCLGISCMIGTAYLFLTLFHNVQTFQLLKRLTIINEISMLVGTALLTIGIFLGAIWANESWGRYWSWDPKETWALITMIVYAAILHTKWMLHCSNKTFNWLSQWAMLCILMTFLGVNYFLSGMHSYGSHSALADIPFWIYLLIGVFFITPILMSYVLGTSKDIPDKNIDVKES